MTVKEKNKRRIYLWLSIVLAFLVGMSACMTSCQLMSDKATVNSDEPPSTQQDAYEAKIVYYEAQIQNLNTQLGQMEQQLYLLRDDYTNQLKVLEQKLTEIQQPTSTPEEPSGDEPEEDGGTDDSTKEDTDTSQDVVLCEYTYRLENGYATLTSYLGKEKDVVIPAAVDGYLVIALGDRMFAGCDVTSVTLPQTVERLGWFTFYDCKNLQKVVLLSGVKNIGYASFDGCPAKLCLFVVSGSFAEKFAVSFGLNYQII